MDNFFVKLLVKHFNGNASGKILGKALFSLRVTISYGHMTKFNQQELSTILAQASFAYIIDNALQKDLSFSAFSKALIEQSIDCFTILIPKSDPMFRNQSILQMLSKKNAKVPSIL